MNKKHHGLQILFLLYWLMAAARVVCAADDPAAQAAREHEQRLQQEQQHLQDKIRNKRPIPDVFLQPKSVASEQPISADSTCVNALDITLVDLLSKQFTYLDFAQLFYLPQDLITSEGLSIGGRHTLRGIEGEGLSGNKDGYIRNELSYAIVLGATGCALYLHLYTCVLHLCQNYKNSSFY